MPSTRLDSGIARECDLLTSAHTFFRFRLTIRTILVVCAVTRSGVSDNRLHELFWIPGQRYPSRRKAVDNKTGITFWENGERTMYRGFISVNGTFPGLLPGRPAGGDRPGVNGAGGGGVNAAGRRDAGGGKAG